MIGELDELRGRMLDRQRRFRRLNVTVFSLTMTGVALGFLLVVSLLWP